MLGALGGKIPLGPFEVCIKLDQVTNLTIDTVEFEHFDINWRFLIERNSDFLSVFLEALDDVSQYAASVSFRYIDSERSTLVERVFDKDFSSGESKIGTSKFLSWDEYINPEYNIVVNDEARICVIITLRTRQNGTEFTL